MVHMTRESILHDSQQVSEVTRLCGLVLVVLHNISPENDVVSCRRGRSIQLGSKGYAGGPS